MKALAITTGAVAVLLALSVVWFTLRSDPMDGEPAVAISIDPGRRPDPVQVPVSGAAMPETDSAEISVQPAAETAAGPAAGDAARSGTGAEPVQQADMTASAQPDAAGQTMPEDMELPSVPVEGLVEESRYGLLPRIAEDGRRPSKVYARPSVKPVRATSGQSARIAILLNGLGLSEAATEQAIQTLPGPVTLAFGPYGQNLQGWVRKARGDGHEVMLQVPLEPFDYPDNDPGPHTLLTSLTPEENLRRLHWIMARFTGYTGVTNHMGARFAAAQDAFLPVLEELKARGLIYLDDGTAARSTAGRIARDLGIDFSVSQVVIDAKRNPESIDAALAKLETLAKENGFAIGVGSSLPVTISRLAEWTSSLESRGIVLIPVSAAVRSEHQS